MFRNMNAVVTVMALTMVVVAAGGCKGKKDEQMINPNLADDQSRSGMNETTTGGERLPEFDENMLFAPATGLQTIYFDYDSFDLRPDALATLRENAEKIKQVPGVMIQIEGHCDERGTQEYNLALGEKRALATRSHLMNLGVSGDRMITISYGEEDPVAYGSNESAWSQNRRAEFNRAM